MTSTETTAGWQLDERGADAYERHLVPRLFAPSAAELVEALSPQPGDHVLDVASGTGIVARHAARRVGADGRVTAVDVSPAMVTVARAVAPADAPIAFHVADAVALPLPDGSVDAVACQQGLQFLTDRRAAVAEMRRVLRPGGGLAVSTCRSLEHQPGYRPLVAALTRHVGAEAAGITASPYGLGDPGALGALLTDAGLEDVDVGVRRYQLRFDSVEELLHAETASSPVAVLVDRLDADVRERLLTDLRGRLDAYHDGDGLVFPFEVLLATASR